MSEQEVVFTLEDGTTMTQDEFLGGVRENLTTKEFTVSVGETRQKRDFEPNKYHMSVRIGIENLTEFIASVATPENKATLTSLALGQLTGRVKGMVAFMKREMHEEQTRDGIPRIDKREGE